MNIKRLLNTQMGIVLISILLGLGLATLFRGTCTNKTCIDFNGPLISEIDGKVYKFGEECYKYKLESASCNPTKQIVELGEPKKEGF